MSTAAALSPTVTILLALLQAVNAAKPTTRSGCFGVCVASPLIRDLGNTLRKVHVNAVIVNEYSLHFEVRPLAVFLVRKLDEGVLQTVPRLLIADDLARQDLAEAREDELEVFVACDWIELAYEQNLLWRCDIRKGKISYQFQSQSLCARLAFSP